MLTFLDKNMDNGLSRLSEATERPVMSVKKNWPQWLESTALLSAYNLILNPTMIVENWIVLNALQ